MDTKTMTVGSFRIPRELSAASWQRDVISALTALEGADRLLVVDCSELRSFDEEGLDMLIGLSRYSERRQVRVELVHPPESLRLVLERRGLTWLFDWRDQIGREGTRNECRASV